MIRLKHTYFIVLPAVLFVLSCGSDDKKEDAPKVVYGTMVVSETKDGNDNTTVELTSVNTCKRNADTGRVDVKISAGADKPSLVLAIKDYSSEPKTYTCKQAVDNAISDTEVGGKFETCSVEASVISSDDSESKTLNTYSMYRETTANEKFTYSGACTINVTTASPSIAGNVTCAGLIQTVRKGVLRNPVEEGITASVQSDFECTFK